MEEKETSSRLNAIVETASLTAVDGSGSNNNCNAMRTRSANTIETVHIWAAHRASRMNGGSMCWSRPRLFRASRYAHGFAFPRLLAALSYLLSLRSRWMASRVNWAREFFLISFSRSIATCRNSLLKWKRRWKVYVVYNLMLHLRLIFARIPFLAYLFLHFLVYHYIYIYIYMVNCIIISFFLPFR